MSNLLKKASIVLTPTAYDDGKVLCAKPSEPPYGDFDFSRNSAATRVNAQGLVENVQILSGNLVQNGDFSELGSEEVSNGSFSQEGVEEITNGDFSNGINNWTTGSSNPATVSNEVLTLPSNAYIFQNLSSLNGKQAKIVVNGSGKVRYRLTTSGYSAQTEMPFTVYEEFGSSSRLQLQNSTGEEVTIDNVSVKEVGQDWSFTSGATLTDLGAKITHAPTAGSIAQSNSLVIGKNYKLIYEITESVSGSLKFNSAVDPSMVTTIGVHTKYFEADGTTAAIARTNSSNNDVTITNISVKEVGQDWTFGTDVTIGDGFVKMDDSAALQGAQQTGVVTNGSLCRVTFTVQNYINGIVNLRHPLNEDVSGNGTYTFTGNANDTKLLIRGNDTTNNFEITNISVIEITDDTNLPRINYEGFSFQDALGSEQVVNGDFENGSANWNLSNGWSVVDNKLYSDNSQTGFNSARQDGVTEIGKTYKLKFTLNLDSGIVQVKGSGLYSNYNSSNNGEVTLFFTADSTTFRFTNFPVSSGGTLGSIDNVSVKEYLGQEVVPDSGCGSWLFEPQSTNLITYSEDFSDSYWLKASGITLTPNQLSPDGQNNAFKVEGTIGTDWILKGGFGGNTTQRRSIYIRADVDGVISALSDNQATQVNVTTQWQRFDVQANSINTFYAIDFRGNGVTLDTVYIWGAQLENQSYATSYIPTSGTSVTRNQDVCTNGGSLASINSTEGVLYFEGSALANTSTFEVISLSDGSLSNILGFVYRNIANQFTGVVKSGGSTSLSKTITLADATETIKAAISYKLNDFKFYVNGVLILADTSGNTPIGLNTLHFTDGNGTSNEFFGKTKAVAVWKEALSDEELTLLTAPAPVAPTFTLDFDEIANQFTFNRASFGTIVNEQGLIETVSNIGPEEIVNGDFATDSDWIKQSGWTISNGSANCDGSGGFRSISQSALVSPIGKTYKVTYEVSNYVSGEVRFILGGFALGQIASSNGIVTETIIVSNASSNSFVYIETRGSGFVGSIDNVSVKEYIEDDIPRIDYSTGTEAFLLEPQSTNLVSYSEPTNGAIGGVNNIVSFSDINSFSTIGLHGGAILQGGQTQYIYNGYSISNSTIYTFSCYMKTSDGAAPVLASSSSDVSGDFVFIIGGDSRTALDSSINYSITQFSGDIYKVVATMTSVASVTNPGNNGIIKFNTNRNADLEVTGLQWEQQSYATSYIPTSGTTVTRVGETCVNATPEINSEEGVLYAEISALANDGTRRYISLSDGTSANDVRLYFDAVTNKLIALGKVAGVTQFVMDTTTFTLTNFNKIAVKYKENDFALWVNGVEVDTDTSGLVNAPNTLVELAFDGNGLNFFGNTKDVQVFTEALSDYQLAQLTTI